MERVGNLIGKLIQNRERKKLSKNRQTQNDQLKIPSHWNVGCRKALLRVETRRITSHPLWHCKRRRFQKGGLQLQNGKGTAI